MEKKNRKTQKKNKIKKITKKKNKKKKAKREKKMKKNKNKLRNLKFRSILTRKIEQQLENNFNKENSDIYNSYKKFGLIRI